jgi:hypothetical protein
MRKVEARLLIDAREWAAINHVEYTSVRFETGPRQDIMVEYRKREFFDKKEGWRWKSKFYHDQNGQISLIDFIDYDGCNYDLHPFGTDLWLITTIDREDEPGYFSIFRFGYKKPNVHICTNLGERLRSFFADIFAAYIQTTVGRKIWIGYGEQAKSKWLLVCLNEFGQPVHQFSVKDLGQLGHVTAMNVLLDDEVWVSFDNYEEGTLVQIKNGSVEKVWIGEWADDLAVHRDRMLLVQRFFEADEWHSKFFLASVNNLEEKEEIAVVDQAGKKLACEYTMGRGSRLYLVDEEDRLYVIDLSALR